MSYWVIGGEYQDTTFKVAASSKSVEEFGPFKTYKEAHDTWSSRAWATVDNCLCRYRIFKDDLDVNPDGDVKAPHPISGHHPSFHEVKPSELSGQ